MAHIVCQTDRAGNGRSGFLEVKKTPKSKSMLVRKSTGMSFFLPCTFGNFIGTI